MEQLVAAWLLLLMGCLQPYMIIISDHWILQCQLSVDISARERCVHCRTWLLHISVLELEI